MSDKSQETSSTSALGNGKREVLFMKVRDAIKDPHRSGAQSDESKAIRPDDASTGQIVRKIWFEQGHYFIEATTGPMKGQLIATPAANVIWVRFAEGENVLKERAARGRRG